MNLELTNNQVSLLQDLIYNEIDRCGGIDNLSDDIEAILVEIREKSLANKGLLRYTIDTFNSYK